MKNMSKLNLSNYCATADGDIYSLHSKRLLKPYQSIDKAGGYLVVHVVDDNGKKKTVKVHRLIAMMFVGEVEGKSQVNHIDGNKLNNMFSNLEWVSPSENSRHAVENNLRDPLKSNPNIKVPKKEQVVLKELSKGRAIYNSDDVHTICELLEEGYRICDVSRMTGFNLNAVKNVKNNRILKYSDIVSTYNFSKLRKFELTSPEKVISICKLIQKGMTNYAISDELGVCRKVVENIRSRKTYTKLTKDFVW